MTEGIVQDKHLTFLAPLLRQAGLDVIRSLQVPDRGSLIEEELRRAVAECRLLLITGGLGPTSDDITREVVAAVAECELVFFPELWTAMQQKFPAQRMAATNKKQVQIPASFQVLENKLGTAPGFYGHIGQCLVFVLPGPPSELRPMFSGQVLPLLAQSFRQESREQELVANSFALSESELEVGLQDLSSPDIHWHTRLETDRLVFTLRGPQQEQLERLFSGLTERYGSPRIRRGNRSLAQRLFEQLDQRGKRLSFAESCTGGLLAKWMTDIPGSSRVFPGSFVVYANEAKSELLGVDPEILAACGAVSRQVVEAMARGVLARVDCEYAIAVSGVAGPGGGTVEKPVGTVWIGVAAKGGECRTHRYLFAGERDRVRIRSAVAAFIMAETLLLAGDIS